MVEELARVVAIEQQNITVSSEIKSTCSSCSQVKSCANGQVAKALPQKQLQATISYNSDDLVIGDMVVIGIPEGKLLLSAWQVYFFPLLGLLSFAGLAQLLSNQFQLQGEWLVILCALCGVYSGFQLAHKCQNRLNQQESLAPRILRKQLSANNCLNVTKDSGKG